MIALLGTTSAYAAGGDNSGIDQYGYVFPSSKGPKDIPSHSNGPTTSASPGSASPSAGAGGAGSGTSGPGNGQSLPAAAAAKANAALDAALSHLPGATTDRQAAGRGQLASGPGAGSGEPSAVGAAQHQGLGSSLGDALTSSGTGSAVVLLLLIGFATAFVAFIALRSRRRLN